MALALLFQFFIPVKVNAENYSNPAPSIQPTTANGYSILFDNTHGETAGAADWVIDGGFSSFANALANTGYTVTELRTNTPITYSELSGYSVFVLPEANIPFKTTEQAALVQYVQNGGSIFFIADHYNADRNKNRWDAAEVFNGYRRGAYADPTSGMVTRSKYFFDILARMFPPNTGYLPKIWQPLLDTLKMSILGSFVGAVLAVPFAVLAASNMRCCPPRR